MDWSGHLVFLLLTLAARHSSGQQAEDEPQPYDIIRRAGCPYEAHSVVTEDGCILQIDRIPREGRPIVFLANQLFSTAAAYLVLGRFKAIAFLLYDHGFDVWLGNYRGTKFSLGHVNMSSSDDKYWEFGWHEHGFYDNPAMINYILSYTGRSRLVYLGHSMGGTTFFVTASERPEVLPKIRAAFLIAPAVFMGNTKANFRPLVPFANTTLKAADTLHRHKQPTKTIELVLKLACNNPLQRLLNLCGKVGLGSSSRFLEDFAIFFPGGGSIGQIVHYLQLSLKTWPGFRKLNLGSAKANRPRYGTDTPPDYDISNFTTPVHLYNGRGDITCTPKDQELLRDKLQNVPRFFFSENENFSHRDPIFSDTAATDMFQYILKDLLALQD